MCQLKLNSPFGSAFDIFFIQSNEALKILNHDVRIGNFRLEDEDEGEDEDEALCFHHNEIFKLFRLQLNRDDEVDCNNIVTLSLSRI